MQITASQPVINGLFYLYFFYFVFATASVLFLHCETVYAEGQMLCCVLSIKNAH